MSSINLSLTDELRAFVDRNCGDGTLYATPGEFLRDVLREKKNTVSMPPQPGTPFWKVIRT